jgi:hypothetical protein
MADRLATLARERHGHHAWVLTRAEVIDAGWFGGPPKEAAAARLGDVVLAAREDVAFLDPADLGEARMRCRHGSVTPAEMYVPLLSQRT